MAEIPSNVLEAEAFAEFFDGFSIGSNDLTQLALGLDRDSERVAHLFDERRETVRRLAAMLIEKAHAKGKKVGICGQAPSDYPEFAAFLVERGIDSLSLNPDASCARCGRWRRWKGGSGSGSFGVWHVLVPLESLFMYLAVLSLYA